MELPGVKTDSIGEYAISVVDRQVIHYGGLKGAIEQEGFWTLPDGRAVTAIERYISDRATGEMIKVSTFIEIPGGAEAAVRIARTTPEYHGVLDVNSEAPVASDDSVTVSANSSIVIDVLANDFDPEGDPIAVDGIVLATHGDVFQNENGTLTYVPDPNYTGTDEFWYWVEDDNGNFSQAHVQVTVEA